MGHVDWPGFGIHSARYLNLYLNLSFESVHVHACLLREYAQDLIFKFKFKFKRAAKLRNGVALTQRFRRASPNGSRECAEAPPSLRTLHSAHAVTRERRPHRGREAPNLR